MLLHSLWRAPCSAQKILRKNATGFSCFYGWVCSDISQSNMTTSCEKLGFIVLIGLLFLRSVR